MKAIVTAAALIILSPLCVAEEGEGSFWATHIVQVEADDTLNVRQGPHWQTEKLFELPPDAEVEVLEENENGWVRLQHPNGSQGWVNGRYLTPIRSVSTEIPPSGEPQATAQVPATTAEPGTITKTYEVYKTKRAGRSNTLDAYAANEIKLWFTSDPNNRSQAYHPLGYSTADIDEGETVVVIEKTNDQRWKVKTFFDRRIPGGAVDGYMNPKDLVFSEMLTIEEKVELPKSKAIEPPTKRPKLYTWTRYSSRDDAKEGYTGVKPYPEPGDSAASFVMGFAFQVKPIKFEGEWMKVHIGYMDEFSPEMTNKTTEVGYMHWPSHTFPEPRGF